MKNVIRYLLLLGVWAGLTSFAQADEADDTRRALAEELLEVMQARENFDKSLDMVRKMIPAQMKQAREASGQTSVPEEVEQQHAKLMEIIYSEMSWDKMKDDFIDLYMELYTEEEMRGIIAFYASPIGQAYVAKQPELTRRSIELSQKMMLNVMPKIREAVGLQQQRMRPQPAVEE